MYLFKYAIILISLFISNITAATAFDWSSLNDAVTLITHDRAPISSNPSCPEIVTHYVSALISLSNRDEGAAKTNFQYILKSSPDNVAAKWGLAEIERRRYNLETSKSMLEKILNENPRFSPAKITLAHIALSDGMPKKALQLAKEVLAPDSPADKATIVRAHLIISRAKRLVVQEAFILRKIQAGLKSKRYLKKAKQLLPNDPGVLFAWGTFYLEAPWIAGGSIKKAEVSLKRAAGIDPLCADIHAKLAQLYYKKKDYASFEKSLQNAIRIDPKNKLALETKKLFIVPTSAQR